MINKLTELLLVGRAYAQFNDGSSAAQGRWFEVFNPFGLTPRGTDAKATFTSLIGTVMIWVLGIVTIIAFVYLIISGVNYITAGGDADKATKARTGILNAIIGIVVVVLSYFILRFAANLGTNLGGR